MTKITIEDEFGKYTVELKDNVERIHCFLDRVVKPAMLAMGYSDKLISEFIPEADLDCYDI